MTVVLLDAVPARADGDADPCTYLYDTGKTSAVPLSAAAVSERAGWSRLEEDDTTHRFQGDAALVNDRLTVVLRRGAVAAEVYGRTGGSSVHRLSLGPKSTARPATVTGFKILEDGPAAVMVEAGFGTGEGRASAMSYRLTTGQAAVQLRSRPADLTVEVRCPVQHVLVPDFFGDDLIVEAEAGVPSVPIAAENFFLGLAGQGDGLVMCVWKSPRRAAAVTVAPGDDRRSISGWTIGPGSSGSDPDLWIAILEQRGIWHARPIGPWQPGGPLTLDWKPPFSAKWRAALRRPTGIAQSWYLQEAAEEAPSSATRTCPCIVGSRSSQLALGTWAAGAAAAPLIVYPIDRTRATPLAALCPIDILRATLGVGPCQYILQTEGLASDANPTPDNVMTWVEKQFNKNRQKKEAEEIARLLDEMTAHMTRAEARLQRYAVLAGDVRAACGEAPKSEPFAQILLLVDYLDESLAPALGAPKPSQRAAQLAGEAAALVNRKDAAGPCQRLGRELRRLGALQDTALARCRLAVRCLKARASAVGREAPGAAQAERIRARAEKALTGP